MVTSSSRQLARVETSLGDSARLQTISNRISWPRWPNRSNTDRHGDARADAAAPCLPLDMIVSSDLTTAPNSDATPARWTPSALGLGNGFAA